MSTPTLNTRPSRLDWNAFPGQTRTLVLTGWPAGHIDAHTYTLTFRGVTPITGTKDLDAETVSFPVTMPDASGPRRYAISQDADVFVRAVVNLVDYGDSIPDVHEATVTVTDSDDVTVDLTVTVLGGGAGSGVPAGGTTGQVLTKQSDDDGDVDWDDASGGIATIVEGAGITVDDTDPANPIVTAEVTQIELDAEATARSSADAALDVRVDALEAVDPLTQTEGDARYWPLSTDLTTQIELDAEATARSAADVALDGRLDAIEAISIATDAELAAAVAAEAAARAADVDAEEAARIAAISGLSLTYVAQGSAAGGDLAGTYPNPTIGAAKVGDSNIDPAEPIGRDKIVAPSAIHLVGAVGEPAFAGTWSNLAGAFTPVGFWLDELTQMVHIQGHPKSTSTDTTIFTLPVGYRPANEVDIPRNGYKGATLTVGGISIASTGVITIYQAAATAWAVLYLDGCSFRLGS